MPLTYVRECHFQEMDAEVFLVLKYLGMMSATYLKMAERWTERDRERERCKVRTTGEFR